ncbi:ATP-binding cassette domain-containing protein [Spiroplasma apis]|uniref:ABC transporter ATP-binding protein n=1 Tax=Spiroplasma apis B31 TaxID=1276258 RepID=V5RK64_SPIAP|nr:ABC transporter ATP-binding protein [Spiroplasma apis]AHB36486.1 ABC transporter ATP-binding protein [Spiroplasma apis B31]
MYIIENIKKIYQKKAVLNIKHLTVDDYEHLGIMGVNGSGKSTLGEIILGTKKPTEGTLKIDNKDLRKNAVFQETSFDNEINLKQIANFYNELFKASANIDELFQIFELDDFKKAKYAKLSGGQKQKFKLLISFINKPNLLLLDELTTSLDYQWRKKIINLIKEYLNKNKVTLILVSHDVSEVASLCKRVVYLEKGNIVKDIALGSDYKNNLEILEKENDYETVDKTPNL